MWRSWPDFLAMGGYGLYVWGSVGACLLVCIIEPIALNLKRRAILSDMQAQDTSDTGQSGT
jgi:heme exporter protein D